MPWRTGEPVDRAESRVPRRGIFHTSAGQLLAPRQQIGHLFPGNRTAEQLLERSHRPQGMESSQLTGRRKQATGRGAALADRRPCAQAVMADRRRGNGPGLPGLCAGGCAGEHCPACRGARGPGPDLLRGVAPPAAVCQGLALVAERRWHHRAAVLAEPLGVTCRSRGKRSIPASLHPARTDSRKSFASPVTGVACDLLAGRGKWV